MAMNAYILTHIEEHVIMNEMIFFDMKTAQEAASTVINI